MESEKEIVIPVRLDGKTFKRFARIDLFRLRRKWVRPAVFSLILIVFAFAALLARKAQSGMIAAVLLVIGIGLPIVYVGSFLSQVNMQALRCGLKSPRAVYTVTLRENGIRVENNQKAFRKKGCIYLYVAAAKAFLLPDGQTAVADEEVWAFIRNRLGPDRCK